MISSLKEVGSIIKGTNKANGLYGDVLNYLETHHGIFFLEGQVPTIEVTPKAISLKSTVGGLALGLTSSYYHNIFDMNGKSNGKMRLNKVQISSSPRLLFETTLAHELVHAWSWQIGSTLGDQDFDYDTEEALCDAIAYEWVRFRMKESVDKISKDLKNDKNDQFRRASSLMLMDELDFLAQPSGSGPDDFVPGFNQTPVGVDRTVEREACLLRT